MKQTDQYDLTAANGWGQISTTTRTRFEIEQEDVGTTRFHYRGHNYDHHRFTQSDVGRFIEVITDGTGYTCWTFCESGVRP